MASQPQSPPRRYTRRSPGSGSVSWDKTNRYWVVRLTVDGKLRRRSAPTKTAAEALLRSMVADSLSGRQPTGPQTTVEEWLCWWRDMALPQRVKSQDTAETYGFMVAKLIPLLPGSLADLTTERVEWALDNARHATTGKRLSKSTATRLRSVLSMALEEAVRRGKIPRNVASIALLPEVRSTQERVSLTAEQARMMHKAAHGDRLEALWLLALTRGLRPGELLGLTWADVDLDASPPVIHLRNSLRSRKDPLGGRRWALGDLKAGASQRTLALPEATATALAEWQVRQRRELKWAGALCQPAFMEHGGLVFATAKGAPLEKRNVRRSFRTLMDRAGIPGEWTTYNLRHSTASLLSDQRVPIETIADLLGHRDTRMVERVYRHQVRPVMEAGADEMDELLG